MALIKCKECNKEYSDKAEYCTECGCPTEFNIKQPMKKDIKCNVKIIGNEKLNNNIYLFAKTIKILSIFFLVIGLLSTTSGNSTDIKVAFYIFIIPSTIVFFISRKIAKTNYKQHLINLQIFEYFKQAFPILSEVKHYHNNIGLVSSEAESYDGALFDIYMEVYNKNADAIVLNDSNVSTQVSGSVKTTGIFNSHKKVEGTTTSKNTFHLTATLIKFQEK